MNPTLPVLFVSHGAPTLVIEDGPEQAFFAGLAAQLPAPRAILCISAHWETAALRVTTADRPDTLHDFANFPAALYRLHYPAAGDPALAARVIELCAAQGWHCDADPQRGLDHGTWVPLMLAWPDATLPVVQLSLQQGQTPQQHYALGTLLAALRREGVLIIASGGLTHNLREIDWRAGSRPTAFAAEFADWAQQTITAGDLAALFAYRERAPWGARNHPTSEHLMPLFVALGAAQDSRPRLLHNGFCFGTISMASYLWEG